MITGVPPSLRAVLVESEPSTRGAPGEPGCSAGSNASERRPDDDVATAGATTVVAATGGGGAVAFAEGRGAGARDPREPSSWNR